MLPARRLWRWHATLVAALAARGALEVRLAPSPAYPAGLRAWLALERTLFGARGGAIPIGADDLGATAAPLDGGETPACDLRVDLGEAGGGDGLSLRFDGRREERALFQALAARRSPRLEVVDASGRARAVSHPAVEVRDELGRSLSYVQARLIALVLRAVEGGTTPAVPPPAGEASADGSLAGFAARVVATKAAAKLTGGRSAQDHWRIALRRAPQPEGDGPPGFDPGFAARPGPKDAFHADPFLFAWDGETFLFVEAYPWATRKGVIACAPLGPDGRPGRFETVLEADHHLSYPQVLADGGEVYMLPETASARRLELYRAVAFPRRWERVATMLEGLRIADATLLEEHGRWWLFASVAEFGGASQDELFAWHGPSPCGPWTAHPANPLVSDVRAGRPAGRFVRRGGRLYRPAQDNAAGYGSGLVWCEVLELTPQTYRERVVSRWTGRDFGPYTGVHTFSEAGGWEAIDLKAPRRGWG